MATQTLPIAATVESQSDTPKHAIPALDGVRALACLGVVSFHMNMWAYIGHIWAPWPGDLGAILSALPFVGEMGFLLFFILSGFLLFLPYARSMLCESPWPSTRRYYLRRIFRVFPGYYVALFFIILFLNPEYLQPDHHEQLWLFLTFRMDLPLAYQQLSAPFWTLAIEFQFYLLLPLFAWLMGLVASRGPLKMRLLILSICILDLLLWGTLTRYLGFMPTQAAAITRLLPPGVWQALLPYIFGTSGKYLEVFALGMLLAILYTYLRHAPAAEVLSRRARRLSPLLFAVGLLLFLVIHIWHHHAVWVRMQFLNPYNGFLLPYKDVFTPLGYSLGLTLCLFAILHGPDRLKRPLEGRALRWVATISYSLYTWHWPLVLYFSQTILPKFQALNWKPGVEYGLFLLWILITTLPLAALLYRWVEVPGIAVGELCNRILEGISIRTLLLRRKPEAEAIT